MRIVAGIFRGRKLAEFKGDAIRPTADNVRESLFNILQTVIAGSSVLDLYSGTGAVGIEAISRGAKSVRFNDASKESIALLKKNLTALGINEADGVKISNDTAEAFLKKNTDKFDIIYVDPPYKLGMSQTVRENLVHALSDGGIVAFENEKPCEAEIVGLKMYNERRYGRVYLSFFKKG